MGPTGEVVGCVGFPDPPLPRLDEQDARRNAKESTNRT
jgi:hypothetical protein